MRPSPGQTAAPCSRKEDPSLATGRQERGGSNSLGSNLAMAASSLGMLGCPVEADGALEESEHQPTGSGFY